MTQQLEFSTALVSLDALLDTRISILDSISREKMIAVLKDGYHRRRSDRFKFIDLEDYQSKYKHRTKAVLKNALVTPITELLSQFAEKTVESIKNSPFHYQPKLIVNSFPYVLTDSEAEALIKSLASSTKCLCDIEIVYWNDTEITPKYLRENISLFILYDYVDWLEYHAEAFKTSSCAKVSMLVPLLWNDEEQDDLTPFQSMETLAAPILGLKYLSIDMFSFNTALINKINNS